MTLCYLFTPPLQTLPWWEIEPRVAVGHSENLKALISLQRSLNRPYSIRRNSKGFDTLNGHGIGPNAQLGLRRTQCAWLVPTQPPKHAAYGFLVVLSSPACSLKMEISFPEPPLFKEIQPEIGRCLLSDWDLDFMCWPLCCFYDTQLAFPSGSQFILPQTQLQILHLKAPFQDLSQGLAISYLPNVHKSVQNSAWASSRKATPDINIL